MGKSRKSNNDDGEEGKIEGKDEQQDEDERSDKPRTSGSDDEGEGKFGDENANENGREEKQEQQVLQKKQQQLTSKDQVAKAYSFRQISDYSQGIVEDCIVRSLDGLTFKAAMVPKWVDGLNKAVIDSLSASCSNMKYVVSTVIYENSKGAGLDYETTMFWDASVDSTINVSWENETMGAIVTVFGIAL